MEDYEIQREIKNHEAQARVQEAIKVIIQEINLMGNETNVEIAIKNELSMTHRTLQQGFFRSVVVPVVGQFADMKEHGWMDLRNEDSCNCAEKMKPIVEDSHFRFV
jgi:hypothetical protein